MLYHLPKRSGRFIDIIQKNNLETVLPRIQGRDSSEVSEVLNPLLSQENLNYYQDKRLIRICQVPQMPYLEKELYHLPKTGGCFREKGNLIEMIKNKSIVSNNGLDVGPFNLVNTKDSPNIYYDKRLIRICQVPQLPYLEFSCITSRKREVVLATRTSCYAIFLNLHKLHKSNR